MRSFSTVTMTILIITLIFSFPNVFGFHSRINRPFVLSARFLYYDHSNYDLKYLLRPKYREYLELYSEISPQNDKDEIILIKSISATSTTTVSNPPQTGKDNSIFSTNMNMNSFFILNLVAVIWGSQHVIIKSAVDTFPLTSLVNFWRFVMSAILFSPSLLSYLSSRNSSKKSANTNYKDKDNIIRAGMELGLYTFLGFAFQAIGLETTTASRSAFLLYLNVKFVPIISYIFFQKQYPITTWASAVLAFLGTAFLSTDGGTMPSIGDVWCIAAAGASAMFILRIGSFSNKFDAAILNSISFTTGLFTSYIPPTVLWMFYLVYDHACNYNYVCLVAILCGLWVLGDIITGKLHLYLALNPLSTIGQVSFSISRTIVDPLLQNFLPIFYLGAISTGLCNYLQTLGQRTISADKAAVIYSTDPIYGAIFSYLILGEQFGWRGYVGAALIMLGVWITAKVSYSTPDNTETKAEDIPFMNEQ